MPVLPLPSLELSRFRISRKAIAALAIVAIVPALYAALFLGSTWNASDNLDRLTAAIVNLDEPVDVDGEEIAAGTGLVDQLTGSDSAGFTWVAATDEATARADLESGAVAAIAIVPAGFSADIASVSGDDPQQATVQLLTNDATSFVLGQVSKSIAAGIRTELQVTTTSASVDSILLSINDIHDELTTAADGAATLADGTASAGDGSAALVVGVGALLDGSVDLADGAAALASGLDTIAAAVADLPSSTAGIDTATDGILAAAQTNAGYASQSKTVATATAPGATGVATGLGAAIATTSGIQSAAAAAASATASVSSSTASASDALAALRDGLSGMTDDEIAAAIDAIIATVDTATSDATTAATATSGVATSLTALIGSSSTTGSLAALAATSTAVATGTGQLLALSTAVNGYSSGIAANLGTLSGYTAALASGTAALPSAVSSAADGATTLATGATSLQRAIGDAADGVSTLDAGIAQLHSGATTLADGLADGAAAVPTTSEDDAATLAETIADPVSVEHERVNAVGAYGEGLAPYFMALALWIGGIVTFLVLRPLSPRGVASSAAPWRVALAGAIPGVLFGLLQAALLLIALIALVGLGTPHLGALIAFAALIAVVFTLIHQSLVALFGPAGRLLALVLLMVQLASAGGTYPVQTAPEFFQAISPYLPMTYAVSGLRHLIAGGAVGTVWTDTGLLILFGIGFALLSVAAVARNRVWTIERLHPSLVL